MFSVANETSKATEFVTLRTAIAVVLVTLTGMFVLHDRGMHHDYSAYLQQWELAITGQNPWATELNGESIARNAYGPLHVVIGYFSQIHPVVPKVLFALCPVAVYVLLIQTSYVAGRQITWSRLAILALIFPLSPLVISIVNFWGINDAMVALFVILACIAFDRKKLFAAGIWLGLAALIKFFPILIALFFFSRTRIRDWIQLVFITFMTLSLGLLASYLVWGAVTFSPFQFGASRPPTMLSILNILYVYKDSLGISEIIVFLSDENSKFVLAAALLTIVFSYYSNLSWKQTALLGTLMMFFVYKVGHLQFYLSWVVIWAWIVSGSRADRAYSLAVRLSPIVVFLSLFQVLTIISKINNSWYMVDEWSFLRVYGSLPFFVVVLGSLWWGRSELSSKVRAP